MTWEQWAMIECFTPKVIFNWVFLIGAGIVSKLFADWVVEHYGN